VTARIRSIDWVPAAALGLLCVGVGVVAGIEPWMGVVAALGVTLLALTFANLAAGLVVLVVVVFAESTPLAGPALSFTKIVGLVLVLGWLARLATHPASSERVIFNAHPAFSYLLAAFLGWAAISVSWATNAEEALTEVTSLLLVAVLYVIVYTAVRTRRQAAWVIGGFIAGAAGTSAYGLVAQPENEGANTERLVSTVSDPNVLAAILVAGFALAGAGVIAARGFPAVRLAAAAAAIICLAGFFLTGSRGGLVAFSVALVAAVAFGGRWRGRALALALLLVTATVAYYAVYAPEDIRDRVASAVEGDSGGSDIEQQESRLTIWTVGWRIAEDNPVIGVGVGNFKEESPGYVLEPGTLFRTDRVLDRPAEAHNSYLHVLAELGIVGVALFIAIVAFSISAGIKAAGAFARVGDWRMEILTRGILVALVGVLAAGFFISWQTGKPLWLLMSLCPAMLAVARSREASGEPVGRPRGAISAVPAPHGPT
jgi:O-antigen ligase